jgi:hypothetical protein
MDRDLHNAIKVSRAISPTRVTDNTAQVSQIIDMSGYNSAEFIVATGTLADADATFTALLEEGDTPTLTNNAAVAAADRIGALPSFIFSDDDKTFKVGYIGKRRYIRLTITPANNTGNADISAVCVQAGAQKQPVA